jgi:hypothetical protein
MSATMRLESSIALAGHKREREIDGDFDGLHDPLSPFLDYDYGDSFGYNVFMSNLMTETREEADPNLNLNTDPKYDINPHRNCSREEAVNEGQFEGRSEGKFVAVVDHNTTVPASEKASTSSPCNICLTCLTDLEDKSSVLNLEDGEKEEKIDSEGEEGEREGDKGEVEEDNGDDSDNDTDDDTRGYERLDSLSLSFYYSLTLSL